MCDPVTITLAAVGATAAVAGTGISAYSAHKQGQFQKDMSRYQANLQKQRAGVAMKMAEVETQQAEKRNKQLVGAGLSAFAANGVLLESRPESAAAMWEIDQAKELAFEREQIRSNAELEAWGFSSNASALRAEGSNAARAGNLAAAGSVLSGVGTVASMGAMAYASGGGGGSLGGSKYMSGSKPTGGWAGTPRAASIA